MGKSKKKPITNCVKRDCTSADNHAISYQVPFEVQDTVLKELFCYFLYRAPFIKSAHKGFLEQGQCEDLLKKINEMANGKIIFCGANAQIEKWLPKVNLSDKELCLKCTRAICKRVPSSTREKESDLACFLRHIRNSIAHGNVFYRKSKQTSYMLFVDYNKTGNMSAKIVCSKDDLRQWKGILSP